MVHDDYNNARKYSPVPKIEEGVKKARENGIAIDYSLFDTYNRKFSMPHFFYKNLKNKRSK